MTQLLLTRVYGKAELLAQFDVWARGRLAVSSLQSYESVLRRFAEQIDDLISPSDTSINSWVTGRRQAGSRASLCSELGVLRTFYNWMHAAGFTARNQALRLPRPKRPPQRLPRYLSEQQVSQLLAAPDQNTFIGLRDHTLMRLAYETGVRAQELVELTLGDVLPDKFLHARGRHVPFSSDMALTLERWQRMRYTARPGKSPALFITQHGKPFRDAHAAWVIVNRYARRAIGLVRGYERLTASAKRRPWEGYHASLLRTSFTAHMLYDGCNDRAMQIMLGLKTAKPLARYEFVDIERFKREHSKLRRR